MVDDRRLDLERIARFSPGVNRGLYPSVSTAAFEGPRKAFRSVEYVERSAEMCHARHQPTAQGSKCS